MRAWRRRIALPGPRILCCSLSGSSSSPPSSSRVGLVPPQATPSSSARAAICSRLLHVGSRPFGGTCFAQPALPAAGRRLGHALGLVAAVPPVRLGGCGSLLRAGACGGWSLLCPSARDTESRGCTLTGGTTSISLCLRHAPARGLGRPALQNVLRALAQHMPQSSLRVGIAVPQQALLTAAAVVLARHSIAGLPFTMSGLALMRGFIRRVREMIPSNFASCLLGGWCLQTPLCGWCGSCMDGHVDLALVCPCGCDRTNALRNTFLPLS